MSRDNYSLNSDQNICLITNYLFNCRGLFFHVTYLKVKAKFRMKCIDPKISKIVLSLMHASLYLAKENGLRKTDFCFTILTLSYLCK